MDETRARLAVLASGSFTTAGKSRYWSLEEALLEEQRALASCYHRPAGGEGKVYGMYWGCCRTPTRNLGLAPAFLPCESGAHVEGHFGNSLCSRPTVQLKRSKELYGET